MIDAWMAAGMFKWMEAGMEPNWEESGNKKN